MGEREIIIIVKLAALIQACQQLLLISH